LESAVLVTLYYSGIIGYNSGHPSSNLTPDYGEERFIRERSIGDEEIFGFQFDLLGHYTFDFDHSCAAADLRRNSDYSPSGGTPWAGPGN